MPIEVIDAGRDLAGKEPGGLVDLALVVGVDPTKHPAACSVSIVPCRAFRALDGGARKDESDAGPRGYLWKTDPDTTTVVG